MPAYNFQERFVDAILLGRKRQTIRRKLFTAQSRPCQEFVVLMLREAQSQWKREATTP